MAKNKIKSLIIFAKRKEHKTSFEVFLIVWLSAIAIIYLKAYNHLLLVITLTLVLSVFFLLCFAFWIFKKDDLSALARSFFKKIPSFTLSSIKIFSASLLLLLLFANIILALLLNCTDCGYPPPGSLISIQFSFISKIIFPFIFHLLLLLLVFSSGTKLLDVFAIKIKDTLDRCLLAIGAGFIPISFFVLFISALGALYPVIILFLFIVIALISHQELLAAVKKILAFRMKLDLNSPLKLLRVLAGAFFLFAFIFNFIIVTKPIPNSTDDLHSYFNTPLVYMENHGLVPLLHIDTANMGQNLEMIYTAIIGLFGPAYMIHFSLVALALTLLVFYSLIKKIKDSNVALVSALVLFLIPWNFYYIHTAKVEFFLSFYSALILICFVLWLRNKKNTQILYLTAVLAGYSVGIKYNALLLLLPLAFYALYRLGKEKKIKKYWKRLAAASALSILLFSPWAIKNQLYFDNFIYPFGKTPEENALQVNVEYDQEFKENRKKEIKYLRHGLEENKYRPISMLVSLWNQSTGLEVNKGAWINFSVFPILILPFFLFLKKREQKFLAFTATAYTLLWYLLDGSRPWYALPGIMLIYSLIPIITCRNRIATGIIFFTMVPSAMLSTLIIPSNLLYTGGAMDKTDYINDTIPYYECAQYINELTLSDQEKILIIGDFRVAFIERNSEISMVDPYLSRSGFSLNQGVEEFTKMLERNSVSFLIYSDMLTGYDRWLDNKGLTKKDYLNNYKGPSPSIYSDIETLKAFLRKHTNKLCSDNAYTLYKLK